MKVNQKVYCDECDEMTKLKRAKSTEYNGLECANCGATFEIYEVRS